MKKKAYNPIKETGFNSKAQMRYLLKLLYDYPEKYGFVKDILREHGVPETEGPLHTYWEPPYGVSPETPSYIYTGRGASLLRNIVRFADKLDDLGFESDAIKLDDAMIEVVNGKEKTPKELANSFWSTYGSEIKQIPTQEELVPYFTEKLSRFLKERDVSESTAFEVQQYLGDKILGREVE